MTALPTFRKVKDLYEQGEFTEAGQVLIRSLFVGEHEASGNVEWPALPYSPSFDGEQIAGIVAGLIIGFTGENNTDNLA